MNAFETTAVLDDALHLTLREPVPRPLPFRECRVIVLFEPGDEDTLSSLSAGWPAGFFEDIHVADPSFTRSAQGEAPSVAALDDR